MKRRLCLVLFLLMLVTCVTASGEAADWNYDANYGSVAITVRAATWLCPSNWTVSRWM